METETFPPWEEEFATLLRADFTRRKMKNHRYSLRSFARSLELSHSAVSALLSGKAHWKISSATAEAVLSRLEVDSAVRNRLLVAMGRIPLHQIREIPPADYFMLGDWTCFAVLFSHDLPPRFREPASIAARLGLEKRKVEWLIEDLVQRGYLVRGDGGEISRVDGFLRTSDGVPSDLIRKSHGDSLKLATQALDEIPMERRDFTSLTFVGSAEQLESLRKEIRALYEKASSLAKGRAENDTLFRMQIQVFPMEFTKGPS